MVRYALLFALVFASTCMTAQQADAGPLRATGRFVGRQLKKPFHAARALVKRDRASRCCS